MDGVVAKQLILQSEHHWFDAELEPTEILVPTLRGLQSMVPCCTMHCHTMTGVDGYCSRVTMYSYLCGGMIKQFVRKCMPEFNIYYLCPNLVNPTRSWVISLCERRSLSNLSSLYINGPLSQFEERPIRFMGNDNLKYCRCPPTKLLI